MDDFHSLPKISYKNHGTENHDLIREGSDVRRSSFIVKARLSGPARAARNMFGTRTEMIIDTSIQITIPQGFYCCVSTLDPNLRVIENSYNSGEHHIRVTVSVYDNIEIVDTMPIARLFIKKHPKCLVLKS